MGDAVAPVGGGRLVGLEVCGERGQACGFRGGGLDGCGLGLRVGSSGGRRDRLGLDGRGLRDRRGRGGDGGAEGFGDLLAEGGTDRDRQRRLARGGRRGGGGGAGFGASGWRGPL